MFLTSSRSCFSISENPFWSAPLFETDSKESSKFFQKLKEMILKMSKTFFKLFKSVLDRQKSLIFCLQQNQNFDDHRNLNLADPNSLKYSKCEKKQFFELRSAKKNFQCTCGPRRHRQVLSYILKSSQKNFGVDRVKTRFAIPE